VSTDATPSSDLVYAQPNINDLTPENLDALKDLHADLVRICTRAQERGVRIILDAEYRYVVGLTRFSMLFSQLIAASQAGIR
jgi:hypothetical protein